MQTRIQSFIESLLNVAIGYGVALASQILIFPVFGINVSISENLLIGAFFTVVSIIRGYFVRRLFNHIHRGNREHSKSSAR